MKRSARSTVLDRGRQGVLHGLPTATMLIAVRHPIEMCEPLASRLPWSHRTTTSTPTPTTDFDPKRHTDARAPEEAVVVSAAVQGEAPAREAARLQGSLGPEPASADRAPESSGVSAAEVLQPRKGKLRRGAELEP